MKIAEVAMVAQERINIKRGGGLNVIYYFNSVGYTYQYSTWY